MPTITEIQVGTTTYTIGSSLPSSWSTAVIPTISVSSETLIINF